MSMTDERPLHVWKEVKSSFTILPKPTDPQSQQRYPRDVDQAADDGWIESYPVWFRGFF
jgi:hypothetical protein